MMSLEKVKAYFAQLGMEQRVLEFEVSSATVELAAQAAGVEPKRIAKTLSFLVGDTCILIVAAGDARVRFIDGETLFGTTERRDCLVDGTHPNDLGFRRMANAITPVLSELLGL